MLNWKFNSGTGTKTTYSALSTRTLTNHTPMTYDILLLIVPWSLVFGYMTWDIFFNNNY